MEAMKSRDGRQRVGAKAFLERDWYEQLLQMNYLQSNRRRVA